MITDSPTAIATTAPPAHDDAAGSRIGATLRLHTVAWPLLIAWPVGILAGSFLISYLIFFLVQSDQDYNFTGSVFAVFGFVLAFYLQAMTQTFPFALGLTVTRHEFFTATTLMALAQSAVFALALYLLSVLEAATDGWGVRMRMFGLARYFTDSPALQFLTLFASLLFVAAIALAAGAVHQRWKVTGTLTAGVVVLGGLSLAALLVTWARAWPSIGSWFQEVNRAVPMVALPLALAVLAIGVAWCALRRATP